MKTDKVAEAAARSMTEDLLVGSDRQRTSTPKVKNDPPARKKRCTLEIDSFLPRGEARYEVADVDLTLPMEIDGQYARMSMDVAEDAVDRISVHIAEVLEKHNIIWGAEASNQFKFATMRAFAMCHLLDRETGDYRQILVTDKRRKATP